MTVHQPTSSAVQHEAPGEPIIEARGVTKRYGNLTAVDSVDLTIYPTEIFGILGPNGAGKTTTLEMIETLRDVDSGSITVAGLDVARQPDQVKQRIGIQLQSTELFDRLSVGELVGLFAALYRCDSSQARVRELLGMVNLEEKAGDTADMLSGGQRHRLSIALAMVNDPEIVFLDEPTTGLDPQARHSLWGVIEQIRADGKTVVLTTHYMEEAEMLCDRVAVMDHGQVILCDTPDNLIDGLEVNASISVGFGSHAPPVEALHGLTGVVDVTTDNGRASIQSTDPQRTMSGLIALADRQGFDLTNLSTSRPTLEDVFLHYTGRALRE